MIKVVFIGFYDCRRRAISKVCCCNSNFACQYSTGEEFYKENVADLSRIEFFYSLL